MITAYALTEPEAGSDAMNAKTTAMLSPDGKYYILNGQKQFISNAGFADVFVTYAKVNGDKFTSFIVERNFEGVSVDEEENKMGMKGSPHGASSSPMPKSRWRTSLAKLEEDISLLSIP